nr:MYB transcription factor protein [Rosa persica]
MGIRPCCSKEGVNKGPWTAEEDKMLADHIKAHGEQKWSSIPKQTAKNMRPSDEAKVEEDHRRDSRVESESSEGSLFSHSSTTSTTTEEDSSHILMDFYTREITLSEFLDTDFTKFSSMISTDKVLMAQGEGANQIQQQPQDSSSQAEAEANDEAPMNVIISQEMMDNLISWEDQSDSDFGYQLSAAFTDFVADEERILDFMN